MSYRLLFLYYQHKIAVKDGFYQFSICENHYAVYFGKSNVCINKQWEAEQEGAEEE